MYTNPGFRNALWYCFAAVLFLAVTSGTASHGQQIDGLQAAEATSSTVTLEWSSYQLSDEELPNEEIAGYNVYRRAPGGTFRSPIGYTGLNDQENGTTFTDSRLRTGETYEYEIRGRTLSGEEVGRSSQITATTESSSEDEYSYGNLKVAVVIYKNASHRNGGSYSTPDRRIEDVKFYFEKARDFFWRNSNMKLNLDPTYYVIDEYKDFGNEGSYESLQTTANHLNNEYGVAGSQYDFIFRIAPSIGGFFSFGVQGLEFFEGSQIGFSHLQWPMNRIRGYSKYPAEFDQKLSKETNQLIWLFIHESQHTIDAIYKSNGEDQMGHGDHPEEYTSSNQEFSQVPDDLRFGERFDYQSTLLRTFDPGEFESFEDISNRWGDVYVTEDQDGDGLPDRDSRVALDERDFGSSVTAADTDDDGLDDKEEATDGIYFYSGSDPERADTDGDGKVDGEDPHPRYDVSENIPRTSGLQASIDVDGDTEEWTNETVISQGTSYQTPGVGSKFDPTVHAAYTRDSLYVALDVPSYAVPKLRFDLDGAGHWFGSGNTDVNVDVEDKGLELIRTFDASVRARQFEQRVLNPDRDVRSPDGVFDTNPKYQDEYGRIYQRADVRFEMTSQEDRVQIEMAIPSREDRGIEFGADSRIGLRVGYSDVQNTGGNASTFDKWSYVYYTLGDGGSAQVGPDENTELLGSSPNPFRNSTTVRYQMKKSEQVRIAVYDLLGRHVETLVDREVRAGKNLRVRWSGESVSSGVYFLRLLTDSGRKDSGKIVHVQ